jgi:hypothetical protein
MIQKDLEVIIKQLGEDEEFPEIKVEIVDNEFSKVRGEKSNEKQANNLVKNI